MKATTETPSVVSFIEQMLSGTTVKALPDGRTIHVNGDAKFEVIDGRLFNRGSLKTGMVIRTYSGDGGKLIVDDVRATVCGENDQQLFSISARSEVEIVDPNAPKPVKINEDNDETPKLTNKQTFQFDGKTHTKSSLVAAVIAKHIASGKVKNISALNASFPAPYMGKYGLFKEVLAAKELSGSIPRYFFKEESLLKIGNKQIAISSQMTAEKIVPFIATATGHGYEIVENI